MREERQAASQPKRLAGALRRGLSVAATPIKLARPILPRWCRHELLPGLGHRPGHTDHAGLLRMAT